MQTTYDLTDQEDVVILMRSSNNETEWNANCDRVKKANSGYPQFWYEAIILGGVLQQTQRTW